MGGVFTPASEEERRERVDELFLEIRDNPSLAVRYVNSLIYDRRNISDEMGYTLQGFGTRSDLFQSVDEHGIRWENICRLVEAEELKTSMHSGSTVRGFLEAKQVLPQDIAANLGYQVGAWDRNAVIGGLKTDGPLNTQLSEVINRPYLNVNADAGEARVDIDKYRNFSKWWRSVDAPASLSSIKNALDITEDQLQARHSRFVTTYDNLQEWERELLSTRLGILNENQFVSHMILADYTMHNSSSDPETLTELMRGRTQGNRMSTTRRERITSQSKEIKPLRNLPRNVWGVLMKPEISADNWEIHVKRNHPEEYERLMQFAEDSNNRELLSQWFLWREQAGRVGWNMDMRRDRALSRFVSWRSTN